MELKWGDWGGEIKELLGYWSRIESRVYCNILMLRRAAMGKAGVGGRGKEGKKVGKALEAVEGLLERKEGRDGAEDIYNVLAEGLERMDSLRKGWKKREGDPAFHSVGIEWRPIEVPFDFGMMEHWKKGEERGRSPMPETGLDKIADAIRGWGRAYGKGKGKGGKWDCQGLPKVDVDVVGDGNDAKGKDGKGEWGGWNSKRIGLEMQAPWSEEILKGCKTIETRQYDLPEGLVGRRVEIMEVAKGKDGVSCLPSKDVLGKEDMRGVKWVGWAEFGGVIKYETREAFEADDSEHMVKSESGYGWKVRASWREGR